MAGVLFIVTVPRKEHEETLRNKEKGPEIGESEVEGDTKVVSEVKETKRLGTIKLPIDSLRDQEALSKCKSSDCLHDGDKTNGLYKCRSVQVIDESDSSFYSNEYKSSMKSSWEELKQVLRPRKNKLKISTPYRGVDILAAFHSDTPLETIVSEVLNRLEIINAAWSPTKNNDFLQVIFSLESSNVCEEMLQVLRTFGVGSRYHSSVSVVPCTLYFKSSMQEVVREPSPAEQTPSILYDNDTAWSRFTSSVRARTNLAQVLHDVKADAALTFDWLFLLIVAAFVAAIGLVENSTVILVASMLISPLMGPITAGTLGTAVRDRSLQHMGVQNELLGLFLSLIIGFIFGLAICAVDERYGVGDWPTYEMMSRCEIRSLWVGVLVAIPSGAGVALAVLGEYTASLVGVAISASLLPPAVNAGLLWAMALVHLMFLDDDTRWSGVIKSSIYSDNPAVELAVLGTVSLCLTLVNIMCIFLAGVAVYKVKEVSPFERRDISWWRANKGLLESSRLNEKENPNAWNKIMQRCCMKSDESSIHQNSHIDLPESVHDDSVAYRRKPLPPPKPKLQNIEAYLQQKAKHTECRIAALTPQRTSGCEKSAEDDRDVNSIIMHGNIIDDLNKKYSFHNMGYQADVNQEGYPTRPTIEPSLCYTVDPKKSIPLTNKSFDV